MFSITLIVAGVLTLAILTLSSKFIFGRRSPYPLPPGPPKEPILGHLRIIPGQFAQNAYQDWSKQYDSDVLYFEILGQPVVVLNSVQAAVDLLDRRGANYADRPRFALFHVLGWKFTLTFLQWGAKFRLHRKLLQRSFSKSSIVQYQSLQEREVHQLLSGILKTPDDWERLMRRFATAIVLGIGFGVTIKDDNDPYIQMATDASYALGHCGAPAGTLTDFFPFVRYFPNWVVRSWSLRFARQWRWAIRQIHDVPYDAVVHQMKTGNAKHSFLSMLLKNKSDGSDDEFTQNFTVDDYKGVTAAIYAAGQDTVWSTLVVFVLNMVIHPEVQKKAQAELDAVIGHDRLPTFEDRERLPYLNFVLQETLRWGPVSPLGVPHRSLKDDVYRGMFIPKGSFVIANALAMTHDEHTYTDPDSFNPERYISKEEGGLGEPFPVGHFGFGRRICPGQYLGAASAWIVMATLLATFDIRKAADENGVEITPVVNLTPGLTSHPEHFPCSMRLRSESKRQLIEDSLRTDGDLQGSG